ncbi:MAG: SDR family oxidoreductase [Phycisphaerae bacterium]
MSLFLVSGGAGFIGSHLAEGLINRGKKVRIIDNFATGKRKNIQHLMDKIELIEGDIRKPEDCKKAVQGVAVVFHEAAIPSVPKSVEDPGLSHQSNVDGTFNMLMAARDAGVKRFVYAASSSAYGDTEISPKFEKILPGPKSPYAVAKLVGEYYCRCFYQCFKLQTIAIRYFNVFGPRQDPASQYAAAIPAFVTAIMENRRPTVYGDGEQSRDFTYIENVIEANLLAAAAPETHGEVINVACGESITVNAIIKRINELLGKNVQPIYSPSRPGDVKHSLADITLAGEVIGYRPKILFDKGLQLAIDWYVKNASFWKK